MMEMYTVTERRTSQYLSPKLSVSSVSYTFPLFLCSLCLRRPLLAPSETSDRIIHGYAKEGRATHRAQISMSHGCPSVLE